MRLNPDPYTLRELVWMFQAHQKEVWDHTCLIVCTVANANRDPKTPAIDPGKLNPYRQSQEIEVPINSNGEDIAILKAMFIKAVEYQKEC
jgi:hypothetical protein